MNKQALGFRGKFNETFIFFFNEKGFCLAASLIFNPQEASGIV